MVDASASTSRGDAAVDAGADAAPGASAITTIDAKCADFISKNDSPEGFSCRGEASHATCTLDEKKTLTTLGAIVLEHEQSAEGTRSSFMIVDKNRHFALLTQIPTEDCDIGDPADVSLQLVSARETSDAGVPSATIVVDALRIDPPFQSGPRVLTAKRISVQCRAGASAPECDQPTTLGTFDGPLESNDPPPFSKWRKGEKR